MKTFDPADGAQGAVAEKMRVPEYASARNLPGARVRKVAATAAPQNFAQHRGTSN